MSEENNGKKNWAEDLLEKRINDYFNGDIESFVFPTVIILDCLLHKMDISDESKTPLRFIQSCLVSQRYRSVKEEQEIKKAIKDVIDAYNNSVDQNKDKAIWPMIEKLMGIINSPKNN